MYGQTEAPSFSIPPDLIARVREGVYGQLASAAEAMVADALTNAPPEPETRDQLAGALALLDELAGPGVELVLAEHGALLSASVTELLPRLQLWLDELDDADERKPGRADELRLLRQFDAHLRQEIGV